MDDHTDGGAARPAGASPAPSGAGPHSGPTEPSGAGPHGGPTELPGAGPDGREPEDATTELPLTGPVRIVGAQPAVEALQGAEPVAETVPAMPSVPDLPPWTDPPTGQVPAVLDRGTAVEGDDWTAVLGTPGWRELPHEWDDESYDPSLLGDDSTRVGSLGSTAAEDDLDVPDWAAGGASAPADPETGAATPSAGAGAATPSAGAGAVTPGDVPGPGRRRPRRKVAGGHRGGTTAPAARSAAGRSGRNLPLAVGTGLGVGAVALGCFALGPVASLVLAVVVVVACAAEVYGSLRQAGHRPATLVGLVGTAGLMWAAYAKGLPAVALVTMLVVVVTMLWYLFGLGRGSALTGIGSTLAVYLWVGLLGCYAALLVAPGQFPHRHGVAFLLGAVAAVVAADVGALAVGAWLGRHRMAPAVSPNKTWEGWAGGAALCVLVSAVVIGHIHPWTPGTGAILGAVVAVVAPLGDLCESLVKRELGLKDMGAFLPGHGGVVDRFDALLFALPATYYLVRVLNLG